MYGEIDGQIDFPTTPGRVGQPSGGWTLRCASIPIRPWLKRKTKNLIDNFETVVSSRWPTVQDIRAPRWSRTLLQGLSAWRYSSQVYGYPKELHWAQRFIDLRRPKQESL